MEQELTLLASFLFLGLTYARLLNATHHWFSLLTVLCAVRIIMPVRTTPRVAAAGILLGIASCFTQTAGATVLLAVLMSLVWDGFAVAKPWGRVLWNGTVVVAAFSLVIFVLNIPLIKGVGWRGLWYYQVVYPPHYLAYWFGTGFQDFPSPLLGIHCLVWSRICLSMRCRLSFIRPCSGIAGGIAATRFFH